MRAMLVLLVSLVATPSLAGAVRLDLGVYGPRQVFVAGGAYDAAQWQSGCPGSEEPEIPGSIENAIYISDAATGFPLWIASGALDAPIRYMGVPLFFQPQMLEPVEAPVAPIDSDGNGVTDRAYVIDSGGTLWRLEFPEAGPDFRGEVREILARYSATAVAHLGGDGRQFIQQVDYVRTRDDSGDYDGVLVVSGAWPERAGVRNYAYLVKDRGGPIVTHEQLPDITQACSRRENAQCQSVDLRRGWKLALGSAGEQGVSRPLVSGGVVYFSTWLPDPGDTTCTAEGGEGRVYAVSLADGAAAKRQQQNQQTEVTPERVVDTSAGRPGQIVASGDKVLLPGSGDGDTLFGFGGPLRWRIYWREEGVDLQ